MVSALGVTDLYRTALLIEGEVSDVDVASCREDTSGFPVHAAVVGHKRSDLAEVRR